MFITLIFLIGAAGAGNFVANKIANYSKSKIQPYYFIMSDKSDKQKINFPK